MTTTTPRRKHLRAIGVTLALGVALTGLVGVGHAVAERASARTATASLDSGVTESRFRLVTYNIRAALSPADAVSDVVTLAKRGADIVALQEMGSGIRRNALRAAVSDCSLCPYDTYMPGPAAQGATPILYRWDKFRVIGSGSRKASDATNVGSSGAGPNTISAKYINWVQLRERATGRVLYVYNNHTVASVQARSCKGNARNSKRLALYRKHMTALRDSVAGAMATGAAVFVTGDFNVNYRCDKTVRDPLFPSATLGGLGLQANFATLGEPKRGTHARTKNQDTRLIDQVWYRPMTGVTAVRQGIPLGFKSDHRPLIVDFTLD